MKHQKITEDINSEAKLEDCSTEAVGDTYDCSCSISKRFTLLFMVFLGFMTMYALRVNLNVAIGAMVNNHTVILNGKATEKVW